MPFEEKRLAKRSLFLVLPSEEEQLRTCSNGPRFVPKHRHGVSGAAHWRSTIGDERSTFPRLRVDHLHRTTVFVLAAQSPAAKEHDVPATDDLSCVAAAGLQ